ncbi:MAG: BlaI/MecI/CopY family transcriptional regulator [Verrucomicrobiales bacterium]|nr:BlaI/MecI/CopY family transcriptional regulator [Verrucomicrobiales bacterium]
MPKLIDLSRRERQIMDILFARGEATVNQICEALPDPPTSMAVRRMMHILEEKGHLNRREEGREVVYAPRQSKDKAGRSAFQRVLETFFGGSLEEALAAHLLSRKNKVTSEERDRLVQLIEQARKEGR